MVEMSNSINTLMYVNAGWERLISLRTREQHRPGGTQLAHLQLDPGIASGMPRNYGTNFDMS